MLLKVSLFQKSIIFVCELVKMHQKEKSAELKFSVNFWAWGVWIPRSKQSYVYLLLGPSEILPIWFFQQKAFLSPFKPLCNGVIISISKEAWLKLFLKPFWWNKREVISPKIPKPWLTWSLAIYNSKTPTFPKSNLGWSYS